MRIKEEFKKSGYFWLSSAPERKIPGTLSISDGGNIELEVVGLFDERIEILNEKDDLKRIVGHIEKEGLVTLDDCFHKRKNYSFGGISKSLIYSHRAFTGVAYDEGEAALFNTLLFSIEGIDEWVGICGIKTEIQFEKFAATISYQRPENILLNLDNGMKLFITFFERLAGVPIVKEASITQKTYFKLVSQEERELDEFISIAYKITTFLCFAIDKIVCLDDLTATSEKLHEDFGKDKIIPIPIKIYYPSLPYSKDVPKVDLHQMLFRYIQISNNAERIINNWINAYEQINPALNLYFSARTGAHKYADGKFLALAQGLETYHRRTSNETLMESVEFETLVKNIIPQCPKEYKKWLKERLKHGNEINLGRRIKSIIEPFKRNGVRS